MVYGYGIICNYIYAQRAGEGLAPLDPLVRVSHSCPMSRVAPRLSSHTQLFAGGVNQVIRCASIPHPSILLLYEKSQLVLAF